MSIKPVHQLYRIYCDHRLSAECLGESKQLLLGEGKTNGLIGQAGGGKDWMVDGEGHICYHCYKLRENNKGQK